MRGFLTTVALMAVAAVHVTASAGDVERLALWAGMEEWLEGEGQGFIVPAVRTTDFAARMPVSR